MHTRPHSYTFTRTSAGAHTNTNTSTTTHAPRIKVLPDMLVYLLTHTHTHSFSHRHTTRRHYSTTASTRKKNRRLVAATAAITPSQWPSTRTEPLQMPREVLARDSANLTILSYGVHITRIVLVMCTYVRNPCAEHGTCAYYSCRSSIL